MAFLQTPLRLWDRDLVKRGISDSVIMQIVDIYSIKVFKGIIKIHFQHLTKVGETVSSKVLQHENRIPSQFRTNHTRHTLLCKHTHTYTNTRAHTVYLWKIPVSFWPRSTFNTGTEEPGYINGAFLSSGGKPRPHGVTRTHSQGSPLTHSHARALCKCQAVGERVYLGATGYFYTFLIASPSPSHTELHSHTNAGCSSTSPFN